jgi:hypothetical protein
MKHQRLRVLWFLSYCVVLILSSVLLSTPPAAAKDPITADDTGQVVDAFVGVMAMAGPEGAAAAIAAKEMKDVMGMLGFFKQSDPIGDALKKINDRLDAIETRLDATDRRIQAVQDKQFRDENLQNTRALRDQRNIIAQVLQGLEDKPTDRFTKNQLTLKAQQVCDRFVDDPDLWKWSDLANRNINWNGQQFKQGEMMQPDFKPVPTLEVYATALATWMAAIEYGSGGKDKVGVRKTYGRALQKHIDFLTTRAGWNEFNDAPQSLPEEVKSRVVGLYVPTSRRPDAEQTCVIAEYTNDDFAREKKLVGNITYVARSANEACGVPANLLNVSTPKEEALEQTYGLDVMALLAEKLTHLKEKGTIREQFIGTFNPVMSGGETLYGIGRDGSVMWFSDNITTRPVGAEKTVLTEHITHKLSGPVNLGRDFSNAIDVLPGGAEAIYVERGNGDLDWYRHDGYLNGKPTWQGPTPVGTGWNNGKIIAMGSGVLYTLLPDGTLRWNKHNNFKTGQGFYAGWAQPAKDVARGWDKNKFVFGGGQGVFYVVTNDGDLYWYRHNAYLDAVAIPPKGTGMVNYAQRLAWAKTWEGPKKIGNGWGGFTKLFCAGNGHIYGVLPSGELRGYDHTGWETGEAKWGDMQTIGSGWDQYQYVFAAMPSNAYEDTIHVH